MDITKRTCENCGHFLQYYAFVTGAHFRPIGCGKCKIKRAYKSFVEPESPACEKWVSNEEEMKKERAQIESGVQTLSQQLYDLILKFALEEKRVSLQMLDIDFRKE